MRNEIQKQYNCTEKYASNFRNCLADVIQDSSFTCNTRDLFQSYPTVSYMMKYSFPFALFAVHAVDLIPLFTNNQDEVLGIVNNVLVGLFTELLTGFDLDPLVAGFVAEKLSEPLAKYYSDLLGDEIPQVYKNYFASFALSGNPNGGPSKSPLTWPVADGSQDNISNIIEVQWHPKFNVTTDNQNAKSTCSFWNEIAQKIMDMHMDIDGGRATQLLSRIREL